MRLIHDTWDWNGTATKEKRQLPKAVHNCKIAGKNRTGQLLTICTHNKEMSMEKFRLTDEDVEDRRYQNLSILLKGNASVHIKVFVYILLITIIAYYFVMSIIDTDWICLYCDCGFCKFLLRIMYSLGKRKNLWCVHFLD